MKRLLLKTIALLICSQSLCACDSDNSSNNSNNSGNSSDTTTILDRWTAGTVVSEADVAAVGEENCFASDTISDEVFARMWKKSWKENCTLQRSDLRYLRLLHRNKNGLPQMGEMIVATEIADKVVRVFRQLYAEGYKIERMVLVDEYNADDEASMTANNTSCFNFRFKTNSTTEISLHGRGLAIDLNPLYNPYVKQLTDGTYNVEPEAGRKYAFDRDTRTDIPYMIDTSDAAYRLFTAEGFDWGGSWTRLKDYQHFEYDI